MSDKFKDPYLAEAVKMAEAFIERAHALQKAEEASRQKTEFYWYTCPRESGALRRQSMELTRALSAWRKPH